VDFELLTTGAGTALPWVGLIAPFLAAFFRRADRCLDLAERAGRRDLFRQRNRRKRCRNYKLSF